MSRFLRSRRLRYLLWKAAGGLCQRCGEVLPEDWHADHVVPFVVSGRTNVHEMQALCPGCNLAKGDRMLRRHQQAVADKLKLSDDRKQLVVHVCPGGGKSLIPVIAGRVLTGMERVEKCLIVVPRLSLKRQAADAFKDPTFCAYLGHRLEVREAENEPNPDRGTFGYVVTYDAIRENPTLHADFCKKYRTLLVMDEVHHVAEDSSTARALWGCYEHAAFRILMTGTMDRNEGDRIAFLRYDQAEVGAKYLPHADITYTMKDGLQERAIIRTEFVHHDGEVRFVDRKGQQVFLGTLTDESDDTQDGVFAALGTDYAEDLLRRCLDHWRAWRVARPSSLMLVVCYGIKQAKKIVARLKEWDVEAAIATSEDTAAAQESIKRFRKDGRPGVLVTVAMAYEGMDVRSITHIACLTYIRSFPWLMQMFGRATRFDPKAGPWEQQKAFVFAPDDYLMQKAIDYVREQQVIGVEEPTTDVGGGGNGGGDPPPTTPPSGGVAPINGAVTKVRASGIDGEDMGYADTAKVQALMTSLNLSGSALDMLAAIRACGGDPANIATPPPPPQSPGPTPGERERALREAIEAKLRNLDRVTGCEWGTWNVKCFREAQRMKQRSQLTERELEQVWKWACEQDSRISAESAS